MLPHKFQHSSILKPFCHHLNPARVTGSVQHLDAIRDDATTALRSFAWGSITKNAESHDLHVSLARFTLHCRSEQYMVDILLQSET